MSVMDRIDSILATGEAIVTLIGLIAWVCGGCPRLLDYLVLGALAVIFIVVYRWVEARL